MRETVPESVFATQIASPDVATHAELSWPVFTRAQRYVRGSSR
jgi:hypothetical protein